MELWIPTKIFFTNLPNIEFLKSLENNKHFALLFPFFINFLFVMVHNRNQKELKLVR